MFKGPANSTNFDEDEEDGELKSSPPQEVEKKNTAVVDVTILKGTEIHIEDGVMIDRTESLEFIQEGHGGDYNFDSHWYVKMQQSVLNPLEMDEKADDEDEPRAKRPKISCFNCGGEHPILNCPEPRDLRRIQQAANEFKERKRVSDANTRYHVEGTPGGSEDYRPGRISNTLRQALGIGPDDIPEWVYRMRKMGFIRGYPPGYLRQAVEKQERGDETLKFHLVEDDVQENKESNGNGRDSPPPKLNEKKIFFYMGFNKTYRHLNDREKNFRIPPFDQFVKYQEENLVEKYWDSRRKKKEQRELDETLDFDDDLSFVVDKNPTEMEDPAEPPAEAGSDAIELKTIPLEIDEPSDSSEPASTSNQDVVYPGTPVLMRKNKKGEGIHNSLPSLEAFSRGITPFQAKEEPTPHKGFLQNIFKKIKSTLNK